MLMVSALALMAASQAHAQQRGAAADGPLALEEVVVTATKRESRLQDVPVSVAVVSEERLQVTGTVSTSELPSLVPGIYFAPAPQTKTTQFVIRGVGTFAVTNGLETSVGIAVDGVPIARPAGQIADMIDIERVEVLKGPQGTLFGKNATAGVIAITTKLPRLGETSTEGNISFGSYRELNIDAAQNIALGEKAALRLTGWRLGHGGYIDTATPGDSLNYGDKNSYGVRAGLTFAPSERFSYTLIGQWDGKDQRGGIPTLAGITPRSGALATAAAASLGIVPSRSNRLGDTGIRPVQNSDNYAVTGIGNYELGGGYDLTSVSAYREVNDDSIANPLAINAPNFSLVNKGNDVYKTWSQELRVASPSDQPLSFVAGVFYYKFEVDDVQRQFGVALPTLGGVNVIAPQHVEQENYAVFGEGTYRVLPTLRLLVGLRYSHDKVEGTYSRAHVTAPTLPITASFQPVLATPDPIKYDFLSYRLGFQYDVQPGVMFYATASRGYKGPGFNFTPSITAAQVASVGVDVNPETVRSYETGLKGSFFDNRVNASIAVFHSTYKNFQATTAVSINPLVYSVQNARELRSKGVEVDLNALVARGLTVGFSGAYTDAKFTDFATAPCYGGQPALPAGSPLTPGFCVGSRQDLSGSRLPQAPKWTGNLNFRYERDLTEDWTGFVTGTVNYSSRVKFEATSDPFNTQAPYALVNMAAGFGPQDGRWTLSVYARNLFDEGFVTRRRESSGGYQQFFPYESNRRVGGMLNFRF
jgi:iron complex outermembrane receptor protein